MTGRPGKGRRGRARESKRDARAPQSTQPPRYYLEREPNGGIAESPAAPILSNRAATLQRFWDETNGDLGVQEETAFLSSTTADLQRGEARQHGVEWLEGKGVGPAAQDVLMLDRPSGRTLRRWGQEHGVSTAREALAALLVRGGYIRRDTADEWLGRRRG